MLPALLAQWFRDEVSGNSKAFETRNDSLSNGIERECGISLFYHINVNVILGVAERKALLSSINMSGLRVEMEGKLPAIM